MTDSNKSQDREKEIEKRLEKELKDTLGDAPGKIVVRKITGNMLSYIIFLLLLALINHILAISLAYSEQGALAALLTAFIPFSEWGWAVWSMIHKEFSSWLVLSVCGQWVMISIAWIWFRRKWRHQGDEDDEA